MDAAIGRGRDQSAKAELNSAFPILHPDRNAVLRSAFSTLAAKNAYLDPALVPATAAIVVQRSYETTFLLYSMMIEGMQNSEYQPEVISTLIQIRSDLKQPDLCADVACHDCPLAIWFATGAGIKDLRCYCTAMHREVWSEDIKKRGIEIKRCDARDGAVAELEKESSI